MSCTVLYYVNSRFWKEEEEHEVYTEFPLSTFKGECKDLPIDRYIEFYIFDKFIEHYHQHYRANLNDLHICIYDKDYLFYKERPIINRFDLLDFS